jgi:hypothetical protein
MANDKITISASCRACGEAMDAHSHAPCPSCGETAKGVNVNSISTIKTTASVSWETRREFWKKNRMLQALGILLIFLGVAPGFYFSSLVSGAIALMVGFLGYFLGPYAITKVREIRRGGS